MAANSGHSDVACIIRHKTDELLVQQHTVSDGQAASPMKEVAKHARYFRCLSSYLVDVCRPGQLCIERHPKIPCSFDPLYWLSENLDCSGLLDASRSLSKDNPGGLWDVDRNPSVP
jgi:hypothetical protein